MLGKPDFRYTNFFGCGTVPYKYIVSWKIWRPGRLAQNVLSELVPDVSQSGGGRGIKAAAPQKSDEKSMSKKHMVFNTIFSRFFMVLASENDSNIDVFEKM